jgi:hypothetical protein
LRTSDHGHLNQPPTVQFARIVPTNGPAPSGTFVAIDVIASDDSGIRELRATGPALVQRSPFRPMRRVSPCKDRSSDNGPNQQVRISAEAIDDTGQSSGEQIFTIPISDGTAPTLP